MKFERLYRDPRPLVNVTATTSGCPWMSAKLEVVTPMSVVFYRSVYADGPHSFDG